MPDTQQDNPFANGNLFAHLMPPRSGAPTAQGANGDPFANGNLFAHLMPQQTQPSSTFGDIVKSAGTGIEKGIIGGTIGRPGEAVELGRQAGNWWRGGKPAPFRQVSMPPPTTQTILEKTGLPVHTPETKAGQYAESIGSMLPAVALPGGATSFGRKAGQAILGGVGAQGGQEFGQKIGGTLAGRLAGLSAARPA